MMTLKNAENAEKFICEKCDFLCSKKSNYEKHLLTLKHANGDNSLLNVNKKCQKKYACECGKEYNHRQGLYTHKKKCIINEVVLPIQPSESDVKILTNLVLEVVKSNADLQKQMLEVCKNTNNINNNSHNQNSHNKTFNLQFFLNEQCKDAMNIMDFVETFQLQFSDLEKIGEVGYVEGISNLIIDKLNGMDIYKRPIHCSDAKREIMHIKDKGVWEKDNENNDKLRLAIKHITKKNIDLIGSWTEKYPGVRYSDHRLNDKFNEIIMEAMGGKNNKTMKEGEAKIIKKISKMVLIDKHSVM